MKALKKTAKKGVKKYADGGKTPPKEVLESMTANRLREALKDAGVGVPTPTGKKATRKESVDDTSIGGGKLYGDIPYNKLVEYAKKKGVYQDARMKAVADFRKEYGNKLQ